jgi:hypothetical protein
LSLRLREDIYHGRGLEIKKPSAPKPPELPAVPLEPASPAPAAVA